MRRPKAEFYGHRQRCMKIDYESALSGAQLRQAWHLPQIRIKALDLPPAKQALKMSKIVSDELSGVAAVPFQYVISYIYNG
jgi:hypothetical protein